MPADPAPSTVLRPGPRLTAAWALSAVVLLLMVVQAVLGLADTGLYPDSRGRSRRSAATTWSPCWWPLPCSPSRCWPADAARAAPRCWSGWGCCTTASTTTRTTRSERPSSSAFLLHVAALVASIGGLLMLATSPRRRAGRSRRGGRHPGTGRGRLHDLRGCGADRGVGRPVAALRRHRRPARERDAAVGGAPRLRHRPVAARAGGRRRRRPALAARAVGRGAGSGDQRERRRVPRRAVGGRRFPGGCRDPRHHVGVTGGDRLGARVHGGHARPARAPAGRGGAGGCSFGSRPFFHICRAPDLRRSASRQRPPRASRAGCRPSTSRAWAPGPRSTSPAPGGHRGATRTA